MTEPEKSPLRKDLERLAALVEEIAKISPKIRSIGNLMLFEAMKKNLDEMTAEQNHIIASIVERSQDSTARAHFESVRQQLDTLEKTVARTNDLEDLKTLGQQIESLSDRYSDSFQDIVKSIVAAERGETPTTSPPGEP